MTMSFVLVRLHLYFARRALCPLGFCCAVVSPWVLDVVPHGLTAFVVCSLVIPQVDPITRKQQVANRAKLEAERKVPWFSNCDANASVLYMIFSKKFYRCLVPDSSQEKPRLVGCGCVFFSFEGAPEDASVCL